MAALNPMQLITMLRQCNGNPAALAQSLMQQNNNPDIANLYQLAQSGDVNSLKSYAQNLFSQNGRNFDQEFANFMNMINPNFK